MADRAPAPAAPAVTRWARGRPAGTRAEDRYDFRYVGRGGTAAPRGARDRRAPPRRAPRLRGTGTATGALRAGDPGRGVPGGRRHPWGAGAPSLTTCQLRKVGG
ncbi:hypothetical protein GCM10010274_02680 [Streptomyces lavendofoliae]|uniref:Uncharacterized protein n=1 Tax=Streptomyces lavendofoliae TaxID=67314 RepID=A0A918HTV0_9ACTN|nr:hypothetical protein GCM10010274_02680 [Streptomyces lavendofoliae]